jgi:hypothetical protein
VSLQEAARRLVEHVRVDEPQDLVRWHDGAGERSTGLHDDGALDAVPGLYEAVYVEHLRGGSPRLLTAALADVVHRHTGDEAVLPVHALVLERT